MAVVESVYSAVRTDSLYTADYVWSLKVFIRYRAVYNSSTFLLGSLSGPEQP